ncbi:MAG: phosphoesterase, partial [Bacteroidota bacterium]
DGLDGLEIIHPSHDASLTAYYRQLARDFGLVATGGSDYHGFRPGDEENLGRYGLPLAALERLHAAIS